MKAVHWNAYGGETTDVSEKIFRQEVENAFEKVREKSIRSSTLTVSGEFDGSGDRSLLVLRAVVASVAFKKPLEAAIVAEGHSSGTAGRMELIHKGVLDLAKAVTDQLEIVDDTPERWQRALQSPEPDIQLLALRLLGAHKVKGSVSEVAKLLTDPRAPVAEAAADTLATIGDPKSVPLIIEAISNKDIRSEVRAIEVLGRIGGKEAEAYLEMTAIGHEIPEVRNLSQHMLRQLQNRKKQ